MYDSESVLEPYMGQSITEPSSMLITNKLSEMLKSVKSCTLRPDQSNKRIAQRRETSYKLSEFTTLFDNQEIKLPVSQTL